MALKNVVKVFNLYDNVKNNILEKRRLRPSALFSARISIFQYHIRNREQRRRDIPHVYGFCIHNFKCILYHDALFVKMFAKWFYL